MPHDASFTSEWPAALNELPLADAPPLRSQNRGKGAEHAGRRPRCTYGMKTSEQCPIPLIPFNPGFFLPSDVAYCIRTATDTSYANGSIRHSVGASSLDTIAIRRRHRISTLPLVATKCAVDIHQPHPRHKLS
ncbi:hypothetical protein CDEST_05545 [Colletotrichum destructivum]|uniref:Uncharacterized protein n=1 Tax=Colletotrichum destructivum TaxID=34406 RepID=A0AAX4IBY9_9PEZI|nr:hypothetical protein CDEST_05545 [Colletotrichum destructivum]